MVRLGFQSCFGLYGLWIVSQWDTMALSVHVYVFIIFLIFSGCFLPLHRKLTGKGVIWECVGYDVLCVCL